MKPPPTIKLGGHDWTIRHAASISDSEEFLYGRTSTRKSLIEVEASQSPQQKRDTVLHEVLHACLTHLSITLVDDEEEKIVRGLTPWLLAALRDNPKLVRFLLEP